VLRQGHLSQQFCTWGLSITKAFIRHQASQPSSTAFANTLLLHRTREFNTLQENLVQNVLSIAHCFLAIHTTSATKARTTSNRKPRPINQSTNPTGHTENNSSTDHAAIHPCPLPRRHPHSTSPRPTPSKRGTQGALPRWHMGMD
jgi:hypothetical protein